MTNSVHTGIKTSMDGVIMRKMLKFLFVCILIAGLIWGCSVFNDRSMLRENLIRLHVIADSDSQEDQRLKLEVRDAILQQIESVMQKMPDMESAKQYLQNNLENLQSISNAVLEAAGASEKATVTLTQENYPTRHYETFTLPAGVYESLRITIGEGEGKNWWCVVFPRFCINATADDMQDTAVSAGFSDELAGALTGQPKYRIRFFALDCLGWLENLFHKS